MYLMYADESGNTGIDLNNMNQPLFSLTGIALEDNDWYNINNIFEKTKVEICPDLASVEVHATDIFSSSKSTKKGYDFRKYTLQEDLEILEKLVDFIVNYQFPIFNCTINKFNYNKVMSKKIGPLIKVDPYLLGFICVSNGYNDFLIKKQQNGMIFLDEVRDKVKDIDILYNKLFQWNFECNTNNIIEKVVYLESCKNNFVQLVDVCNFYINKYYSIKIFDNVSNPIKKQHCINMYNKLEPYIVNCKIEIDDVFIKKFFI